MSERIADRYELGELIGTGGMSEVYAATDTLLGREVAVKMLRPDLARDINFRERFRKEAQNSSRLNHPAIVAVYDTGEYERDGVGTPFIVMELVHGRTIRDIIREDGPMTPTETAKALVPVCGALQASHEADIIHRDIKPANIMITNTGSVKIMDFGIAQALNDATSAMTQTSAVIGTAQYLSPEQARGKNVDGRSDLYALGCVMYEMVAGKPPFEGDSPFSVAYQHVQEDPTPPSEFVKDLSPTAALNLDAVILSAMAKHPGDRYQSAQDMAEDLARLERGSITHAARNHVEPEHQEEQAPTDDDKTTVAPAIAAGTVAAASAVPVAAATAAPEAAAEDPEEEDWEYEEYEEEEKGNGLLKALAALLSVVILGVGAIFAYDYFTNDSNDSSATLVQIPELNNKPQTEAVSDLERLGLLVTVNSEPNPEVPRGVVIRTNPATGSAVPTGSTVTVTVSSGKEITEVPDVRDMTTEEAQKALEEAGLELDSTVREESSDDIETGLVMDQSPAAGAQVSKGSRVTITVSTGVEKETVPSLAGMRREQAESLLTSLGFKPQVNMVDSKEPEGTVISASGEGQELEKDSTVTVEVSNGMLFSVPTIVRQSRTEALATLRNAGWEGTDDQLKIGEPITTPLPSDANLIGFQEPTGGAEIRKDADINVRLWQINAAESASDAVSDVVDAIRNATGG